MRERGANLIAGLLRWLARRASTQLSGAVRFGSGRVGRRAAGCCYWGGAVTRAAVPVLRTATVKDLDSIGAVMRASVLALFPPYYDERQTASAAVHIAHVDPVLVADGTYFVFVADG